MNCPRCTTAALEERDRDGLVVDACPTCRGIWLDRGELERLIARATQDYDELARDERGVRREPPRELRVVRREDEDRGELHARGERYSHDDRRDDHDGRGNGRHEQRYPHRRKRWFEALGDIFD